MYFFKIYEYTFDTVCFTGKTNYPLVHHFQLYHKSSDHVCMKFVFISIDLFVHSYASITLS